MPTFFDPSFTTNMGRAVKYETQIDSGSVSAGASGFVGGMNQRRLRDEAAAARAKEASLNKIASSPEVSIEDKVEAMSAIDADYAKKYEKQSYENLKLRVEHQQKKNEFMVNTMIQAIQTANSGNQEGAVYLANQLNTNPQNPYVGITKDNKTGNFLLKRANGDIDPPINENAALEAGVSNNAQWAARAEMARLNVKLSLEGDAPFNKRFGRVLKKKDIYDRYLAQAGGDQTKAIELAKRNGDEVQFTNTDLDILVKGFYGSTIQAGAQGFASNPALYHVYSANKRKGETEVQFLARLQGASIKEIGELLKSSFKLPMVTSDVKPGPSPDSTSATSISVTTKTGPSSLGRITIYKDGKAAGTIPAAQKDQAIREGYTLE